MDTILFPTDLSAGAAKAYIYALHLARKLDARIVTLHVYEKPEVRGATHIPPMLERFYEEAEIEEFDNYKDSIPVLDAIASEHGFDQLPISHTMIEGEPKKTIIKQAGVEKAALIVMGTTGASGIKKIFMGSVAGEVLENAPCPVLAVPADSTFDGQIDQIAFSFNYQEDEIAPLRQVIELAKPFNATIHAINVDLANTEGLTKRMEKFRADFGTYEHLDFKVIDAAGRDLEEVLTDYLEEHQIDILAMVTHKRGFWQELFHYSKTKAMSYQGKTPVLSFPVGG